MPFARATLFHFYPFTKKKGGIASWIKTSSFGAISCIFQSFMGKANAAEHVVDCRVSQKRNSGMKFSPDALWTFRIFWPMNLFVKPSLETKKYDWYTSLSRSQQHCHYESYCWGNMNLRNVRVNPKIRIQDLISE